MQLLEKTLILKISASRWKGRSSVLVLDILFHNILLTNNQMEMKCKVRFLQIIQLFYLSLY